jgi:hypothetical protein
VFHDPSRPLAGLSARAAPRPGAIASLIRRGGAGIALLLACVGSAAFALGQVGSFGSDADFLHDLLALETAGTATSDVAVAAVDSGAALLLFLVLAWASMTAVLLAVAGLAALRREHAARAMSRTGLVMALALSVVALLPPPPGLEQLSAAAGRPGALLVGVVAGLGLVLLRRPGSAPPSGR